MPSDPPYKLDTQVGYLLRLAAQRNAAIFAARMAQGLTPTQFAALVRLAEVGACSQNHLGRLTAMDAATVKGVVARLVEKGLIATAPDPDDKRRTRLTLSERGIALMPSLYRAGAAITRATLDPLDPDEADQLLRLLHKLT